MSRYSDFIPQNVATIGTRRIGIYDANGNRVGQIPLGNLTPPNPNNKLYSIGVLADIHLPQQTGEEDYKRAMEYLVGVEKVDFITICGDLTYNGTNSELANYKTKTDAYRPVRKAPERQFLHPFAMPERVFGPRSLRLPD